MPTISNEGDVPFVPHHSQVFQQFVSQRTQARGDSVMAQTRCGEQSTSFLDRCLTRHTSPPSRLLPPQVVLQLERLAKLFPPLARYVEAQYGRWLCEVVEETEGEGGARTVVVKRTLNVERVAFDQVTETKQEVLGTSKVDDDARVFRRADELVPAEELLQRERLAFGEGGKRGGVSEEQLAVRQRIQSHPSLGGVGRTDKLLVIDMQHSFIKGAEPPRGLQVCGAEEIVMPCNELIRHFAMRGATVAFTQVLRGAAAAGVYAPPTCMLFSNLQRARMQCFPGA